MTLQSTGDIFREIQEARRAADQKRERNQQLPLDSLFTLTPPSASPKKKKGPKRIEAPRQCEINDLGHPVLDVGFIAREFAMLGLPHSDPGDLRVYRRTNGRFQFRVTADIDSFLPYGMYPRILAAWVATEACRTKNRTIYLGKNLSRFLEDTLGLKITGGKNGTITALKEQMWRFFTCEIALFETMDAGDSQGKALRKMPLTSDIEVWWHPKSKNQDTLFESQIVLGERFFQSIIEHPVPIDWNTVKKIRKSPLATDLYFWIAYRMGTLSGSRATVSLWGKGGLAEQIGSNYDLTVKTGKRDFRRKLEAALVKVKSHYRAAVIELGDTTVTLIKSPTHVPRTKALKQK